MADEEEDDYLSDKFLADLEASSAAAKPKTYSEKRREAERAAHARHLANRPKSVKEAREEALSTSLFERAQEPGGESKGLALMMKMGFTPGQALGKADNPAPAPKKPDPEEGSSGAPDDTTHTVAKNDEDEDSDGEERTVRSRARHRIEPLPLNEWAGRKGIGLGPKRALSPTSAAGLAKRVKVSEQQTNAGAVDDFRGRAREEHAERRAAGRVLAAQRTCATLDERAGVSFNVLWLHSEEPDTFPPALLDALETATGTSLRPAPQHGFGAEEQRLRNQMRADALRPISALEKEDAEPEPEPKPDAARGEDAFTSETVEQAAQFLRLPAKDRLAMVLDYLRRNYHYCFWCGTQYGDVEDMASNCPGETEDDHD